MRIVGGLYRHRIISWPEDNVNIRPTKDRIREAIFSALGPLNNKISLDLYAGSGAMGIEGLSRGSKFCYFVDINKVALKTINHNLTALNVPLDKYEIIFKSDFSALEYLKENNIKIDIVYIDPPYALGEYQKILNTLYDYDLLNSNAIMVLESNKKMDLDLKDVNNVKEYKYGDIYVYILRRQYENSSLSRKF